MVNEKIHAESSFIDVEKVIRGKSQRLGNLMPGFLIRYLKKIVHQDEINALIDRSKHLFGLGFVDAIMKEFGLDTEIHHIERIPLEGRVIVASNHPLGGIDGIGLMQTIGKVRSDIQFPVNDILMNLDNLKPLFIPINKHGSNAENIQILNNTFAGNSLICYFPFGLVSRKKGAVIKDLEWKKTFITKARKYKRDIIPTHISGRNTNFFYRLSNLRKMFGIKANIEMLYLVDEFYKQRGQVLNIRFGEPIPWQTFDRSRADNEWAEQLRRYVYTLPLGNTEPFDPKRDYPFI
jgi:putative hemolysin